MAEGTSRMKFRISYGSPVDGAIIRAGAVTDVPEFWAKWFEERGIAERVTDAPAEPSPKTKKPKK